MEWTCEIIYIVLSQDGMSTHNIEEGASSEVSSLSLKRNTYPFPLLSFPLLPTYNA